MRVLLADDQVWLRSALRLLLEHEANMDVVGEANSVQSLGPMVPRLSPDALLLDWHLPGFTTSIARRRFIESLRAEVPHLYIFALTSDDNPESCLRAGANAIINKAESPDRIISSMRCAEKRPGSSAGVATGSRFTS